MANGLVASPCLSPGLLLILDYVSSISAGGSIQSYIEGFLLLFAFGIGSSLPLLIIGTISSSSKILPKAGAWMVEIKKLVGLLLIGMAYLSSISFNQLYSLLDHAIIAHTNFNRSKFILFNGHEALRFEKIKDLQESYWNVNAFTLGS